MNNDLISRETLKKALHNFFDEKIIDEPTYILRDVFCYIDNAPTVEYTFEDAFQKTVCEQRLYCPERPQGVWINTSPYDDKGECSLCCYLSKKYYKFCPYCGASMKKGDEE